MSSHIQQSFASGIDLINADSHIAEDGYAWLVNARQRLGFIEPNKKNLEITDIPPGVKQALASVGNIMIAFVAGRAYYKEEDSALPWQQIPNFLMDENANIFYTENVPASTLDFVRKLDTGLNIHAPIIATTDFKVAGTPAAVVVQDGTNQPWIIEYDSTNQIFLSRVTKNFNQWQNKSISANDREYVPIGKQMMYKDGILHIASPDRKKVYRSVTGRALDFMINVDQDGNKAATETLGGAATTSYAMDFDEVTCLSEIDVPDSFIYATAHTVRIITADYTNTIWGEPTFRVSAIIKNSGIVNHFSISEALNDYVFIASDGIKSFNAVQQLKFKGNSSIFSKQLQSLLQNPSTKKPVKQLNCSCIGFLNYVLFNIDSLWGNIVAVYDVLLEKWVSLDITKANRIKQFQIIETELETRVYCITNHDEMFELYGDVDNFEVPQLRVKGFVSPNTMTEHKSAFIRPFFNGGSFDGKCYITEYVDDQLSVDPSVEAETDYRYQQDLKASLGGVGFPVIPPVFPNNIQCVDLPGFPITRGLVGKKLSFVLQWTNDAKLVELQITTTEQTGQTSAKQKDLTNQLAYT